MGFGIVTIGCLSLLLIDWGGSILAGLLCAYGLYLASRLEKRYLYGAVASLFMMPHGIVLLLDFVLGIKLGEVVSSITYIMLMLGWAGYMFFMLTGTRCIAVENNAKKFESRCNTLLYFCILYFAAETVANLAGFSQMQVIMTVAKYIIIILMIWFAHTCFVYISTPQQTEKDIADVAAIEKKERERRERSDKKFEDAKIPQKAKNALKTTKKDKK